MMKNDRHVDLSELRKGTNGVYYPLFHDKSRYLVLYGGAGSGKSVFAAQKKIRRVMSEPGHRILVIRKVATTLRNSVFTELKKVIYGWGVQDLFKINDLRIKCLNGSEFIFAGLDDAEKLKSITGITSIWIEEATELTEKDFNQIDLRLRGKTKNYHQIILSFNPISALSWLKRRFFDIPDKNATVIKTTAKDNRYNDDAYQDLLDSYKQKDHYTYLVYTLGEWGVLGNLIYTNWTVEEISTDDKMYGSTYQGLDFGFNNPSAYAKLGLKDDEIYIYKEFYRKGLTNPELIQELEGIASKQQELTADSAEPDRIKEFKQNGYRIKGAKKEKGSVESGIDYLKSRKIHVHPSCVNTIKELQSYKYKEDKDGNVFDTPVDMYNHILDAARYACDDMRQHKQTYTGSLSANNDLTRVSPNR